MRRMLQRIGAGLRRPAIRLALLLAAVFAAGLVSGVALDRSVTRRAPRFPLLEGAAGSETPRLVRRMQRTLRLDPEQTERVREVLERRQPQMRSTWTAARATLLAQLDSTLAELNAILTPEQRAAARERLEKLGDRPVIEALLERRRGR